jgi:predicted dienelactone hydrolase
MIRRFAALLSILPLTLVFLSCASAPNQLDEEQGPRRRYSGQAGESPVGVIPEGTLRDATRDRNVVFTVEYPTRPGLYPLIVFSHGFGATRQAYVGLSSHWASQGYVVIKPAHVDSGRLQTGGVVEAWEGQTQADWRNRVRDITFIIDSLDQLEKTYPELQGKIDRTKIGVGGHSYGAFTAMLVGGARTFPGNNSYADPRIKAIVAMSPQGPDEARGLTTESWRELRVPTLFMTGTQDRGTTEAQTPEWRRQAFELSPAGDKWLAVLEGARSASFIGRIDPGTEALYQDHYQPMLGDDNPRLPSSQQADPRAPGRESAAGLRYRAVFADVKAVSLAFWDTYLRGDAEGRTALEASRGGVTLTKK